MDKKQQKNKEYAKEKHRRIHMELHASFDELLADYQRHTKGTVLDKTIRELMQWSYEQTINPTD